jgi:general nucleoside transport system permease protein
MISLRLTKRPQHSSLFSALSPFIAFGITLVFGFFLFLFSGKDPFNGLYIYFVKPLIEVWSLHELAIKSGPLILIAVGLSVAYRSNNWNIGAEGQFIAGGLLGSVIPIMFPTLEGWFVIPLMLIMGMIGGAAFGAIPAFLKVRFQTNEILTSLMLVYVIQLFLDWMVRGPWRNPEGSNFPETRAFNPSAVLPEILPSSGRAHWGFIFAIIAAILIWFVLSKTKKGFEVKVLGASPRAGKFAGFSQSGMVYFAFLVSGACAGLAGISEVSGAIGKMQPVISPGYGFTAIIVAFLGRLNPLGIIAAGLVLGLTYLGGEAAQFDLGISDKLARVFQGVLLFLVLGCDTLINYSVKLSFSSSAVSGKAA